METVPMDRCSIGTETVDDRDLDPVTPIGNNSGTYEGVSKYSPGDPKPGMYYREFFLLLIYQHPIPLWFYRRNEAELTVDQHHLLLDNTIGALPVVMFGDVESVLPSLTRRRCRGLEVSVNVEARRPARPIASAVARWRGARLDTISDLELDLPQQRVSRWGSQNGARGEEARDEGDSAREKPHDETNVGAN